MDGGKRIIFALRGLSRNPSGSKMTCLPRNGIIYYFWAATPNHSK